MYAIGTLSKLNIPERLKHCQEYLACVLDVLSISFDASRNATAMFESGRTLDRDWLRKVGYLKRDNAAV